MRVCVPGPKFSSGLGSPDCGLDDIPDMRNGMGSKVFRCSLSGSERLAPAFYRVVSGGSGNTWRAWRRSGGTGFPTAGTGASGRMAAAASEHVFSGAGTGPANRARFQSTSAGEAAASPGAPATTGRDAARAPRTNVGAAGNVGKIIAGATATGSRRNHRSASNALRPADHDAQGGSGFERISAGAAR